MTVDPHLPPPVGRFVVRQKITLMVNRYEILTVGPDGSDGELVAFAEQKRMALREQVTFYADASRSRPLFGFKARNIMDVTGTTDVLDGDGVPIGTFSKDFGASLLRSTWHLECPALGRATGVERSQVVAVLRRVLDSLSWLPFHFDFTGPDGPVMAVEKSFAWGRDRYLATVYDARLDSRVAMAMAVALDALQAR